MLLEEQQDMRAMLGFATVSNIISKIESWVEGLGYSENKNNCFTLVPAYLQAALCVHLVSSDQVSLSIGFVNTSS
jgi:hypothetical protein